jgi:hypothetical protein
MKVNRNNYEAYFLDFHEGNLSEELKREVIAFVKANPELKDEFESFEMIFVESQTLKFPAKESLKKTPGISIHNYKTWLVAYVEGDLKSNEAIEVEKFVLENPSYGQELEILRRTKIHPDYSILFAGKSSLKKGGIVIPLWVHYAAAASVVIALLAYFFVQQKPSSQFVHESQPENKISAPSIVPQKNSVAEIKSEVTSGGNKMNHNKPLQKKSDDVKVHQELAANDTVRVQDRVENISDQLIAEKSETRPANTPSHETTIVINEGISNDMAMEKMVVLDDNDLAELGLKEKQMPNSKLADAVNGVGKLFNVNAHYAKTQQEHEKPTETWALGPLKIKRTIAR